MSGDPVVSVSRMVNVGLGGSAARWPSLVAHSASLSGIGRKSDALRGNDPSCPDDSPCWS